MGAHSIIINGKIFGSLENVNKEINGDLEITYQQAKNLGNLFHVDGSLFMED